jgi:septum site-determining protein MinC
MPGSINIKGISQGVLATLPAEGQWEDLVVDFLRSIDRQAAFFRGAQVVIDARDHVADPDDLRWLMEQLTDREVKLAGILSSCEATLKAAAQLELATDLSHVPPPPLPPRVDPDNDLEIEQIDSEEYGTGGVLIKRTLRSGRTVRSMGHVVVIGDVNSGAEIVAVGDIIIWGKLRGIVHAGAQGDESAVVCALDMAPTQLRIAGLITIPPKDKRRNPTPETAYVSNGRIEVAPWMGK